MEISYVVILILIAICYYLYSDNNKWEEVYKNREELLKNTRMEVERYQQENNEWEKVYKNREELLKNTKIEAERYQQEAIINFNKLNQKMNFIRSFEATKIKDFPVIATVLADYETAIDAQTEKSLREKKRPAIKAADELKAIRIEKRNIIAQNKAYKWELEHLKNIIPWIDEIEEDTISPVNEYVNPDFKDKDLAGFWLKPDEYKNLNNIDKYQLALDRYCRRKKSNIDIGLAYERYIGYLYESHGYTVEYFGIEYGKEDLGRDLICYNDKEILVVQCKCWSNMKNKVIREKYICQLYGTTVMYSLNRPKEFSKYKIIRGVFVSTVPYTPEAKKFSDYLKIEYLVIPLDNYPMIKCNINMRTGEKIYHLPFDQQYDKCVIKKELGECYALTVKEAENKGFRRAKKWLGN